MELNLKSIFPRQRKIVDNRINELSSGVIAGVSRFVEKVWRQTSDWYTNHRNGFRWYRCRRRYGRSASHLRIHDVQFLHASNRSRHQFGSENILHVGRHRERAHRIPWAKWCRGWCRRTTFTMFCRLVFALSRLESNLTVRQRRCQR